MNILGYSFNADTFCVECTEQRYPLVYEIECFDNEGNPVHPIFDHNEALSDISCGNCHESIQECTFITPEYFNDMFPSLPIRDSSMKDGELCIMIELTPRQQELLMRDGWLEYVGLHSLVMQLFKIPVIQDFYELEVDNKFLYVTLPLVEQ